MKKSKKNRSNKLSYLKLFSIPILMGVTVLIAAIFAKNTTVQKSLSVVATKTVACTAANYSTRTSDSNCGAGYTNTGNTCATTTVYTCSKNASLIGAKCKCYNLVNGTFTSNNNVACSSTDRMDTPCSDVCGANGYTGPGSNDGSGDENKTCGDTNTAHYECTTGTLNESTGKCTLSNQSSCDSGWSSTAKTDYTGQITCTAKTSTVTFNVNGGTAWTSSTCKSPSSYSSSKCTKTVTYSDTYGTLPTPTRTGYSFAGWYTASSDGTKVTSSTIVSITSDQTLYAYWTPYVLSIQYNGNGGNWGLPESRYNINSNGFVIDTQNNNALFTKKVNYGSDINIIHYNGNTFRWSKTGYHVNSGTEYYIYGYSNALLNQATRYTAVDLSSYAGCTLSNGDCLIKVYVNWKPNTYTVVYNKNNTNAGGSTSSSSHTYGTAKTLTANGFTLGGHIFNGWNTNTSGTGTNYSNQQSVTNLTTTNGGTVNLYAKWKACPAGQYAAAGATSCSDCTGNTYTSSAGQSSCTSCATGYKANSTHTGCTAIGYTVVYNKNNTNAGGSTASSSHTYGVAKTLTANGFTLGGHIFNGWNTNTSGTGTNYSNQQSVTNLTTTNGGTVNLYAKWKACPAGQYATAGATSCSDCTGNTYTSSAGQSSCTSCATGYKANSTHTGCTAIGYTVVYNKNNTNAGGSTASSSHTYGVAKALTANGFTLGGHIFNGWNTNTSGTGTNYNNQQSVTNLTTTDGATVNLYAKWKACPAGQYATAGATSCSDCTGNTYTSSAGQSSCTSCATGYTANSTHTGCTGSIIPITLDNQGAASAGTATIYLKYNTGWYSNSTATTSISSITVPTKTGYVFGGYFTQKGGKGDQMITSQGAISASKTAFTSATTLYAKWTPCGAGKYLKNNACEPCEKGKYSTGTANASCDTCPSGYTTSGTGSTAKTACQITCAENTRVAEADKGCVSCDIGYVKEEHTVTSGNTSVCKPNIIPITLDNQGATAAGTAAIYLKYSKGWYSNSTATTSISSITKPGKGGYIFLGYYKAPAAQQMQIINKSGEILSGKTTEFTSASKIYAAWTPCPAGKYATAGATSCTGCINDTYTDKPGQSSCLTCPEGKIANNDHTGCVDKEPDMIECAAGTYLPGNQDTCVACPEGYYCPGGYFKPETDDQGKEDCPTGHVDGGAGLYSENQCTIKCDAGYWKDNDQAVVCVACPVDHTSESHYVKYSEISPAGTCYSTAVEPDYACYACGDKGSETYTWTNEDMSDDPICSIDTSKNAEAKCRVDEVIEEETVSPKTGLLEVGGILLAFLGVSGVTYFFIRKKKLSNI